MTPLCFIDTETTGLHPDRVAWEIAIIRRDKDGEKTLLMQIEDVDLSNADPMGLKVGGFYDRHKQYGGEPLLPDVSPPYGDPEKLRAAALARGVLVDEQTAAYEVEKITRGAHLVGAVPDFDARTLDPMLRRYGLIPAWHYHLIDVEAMAVGWLSWVASMPPRFVSGLPAGDPLPPIAPGLIYAMPPLPEIHTHPPAQLQPPWRSDDLSRACGVEPPSDEDRHTALGDARWAMRWYDVLVGGAA